MSSRPNLRTISVALSALLLPLSILAGVLTAAYYKSSNPDNVDITNGLAYLRQTMFAAIAVGVIIGIIIIVMIIKMYRRDGNFIDAKLPLVLLVAIAVIVGSIAIVSNYTSSVEDQYRIDRGQPTLQQFFDKLEQNKS